MKVLKTQNRFYIDQQNIIQQKVFIVVPTLNSYENLEKLISTLKMQESKDWRVLFIDGLSSKKHKSFLKNICNKDKRFTWENQSPKESGIFGAMNIGFQRALPEEWLLFWGSDDWLPSQYSLSKTLKKLTEVKHLQDDLDIFICNARYYSNTKKRISRLNYFIKKNTFLGYYTYKFLLFLGRTPPHQTTFLSQNARKKINKYSRNYKLSADLNYFLKLSNFEKIKIYNYNFELLYLSEGGISSIERNTRLKEVLKAYFEEFSFLSIFPFLLRYLFKIITKLSK